MYCGSEYGDENGGKKGQGGVGLAVRTSITRAARPPEFISDRLLKVTLELRGRAKAVTFFVAYAPTETHNASNKHAFWTTLNERKNIATHATNNGLYIFSKSSLYRLQIQDKTSTYSSIALTAARA